MNPRLIHIMVCIHSVFFLRLTVPIQTTQEVTDEYESDVNNMLRFFQSSHCKVVKHVLEIPLPSWMDDPLWAIPAAAFSKLEESLSMSDELMVTNRFKLIYVGLFLFVTHLYMYSTRHNYITMSYNIQ